jgi:hypothetical protein
MNIRHFSRCTLIAPVMAVLMVFAGGPTWCLSLLQTCYAQEAGSDSASGTETSVRCSGASGYTVTTPGGPGACGKCTWQISTRTLGSCITGSAGQTCHPGNYATTSTKAYAPRTLTAVETAACWASWVGCYATTGAALLTCPTCGPESMGIACLTCIEGIAAGPGGGCACYVGEHCVDCELTGTTLGTYMNGCIG